MMDTMKGFGGKNKTPDSLLQDAIAAFDSAQAKVTEAIGKVEIQMNTYEQDMADLQAKVDNCSSVHERLLRVGERIKEFVS